MNWADNFRGVVNHGNCKETSEKISRANHKKTKVTPIFSLSLSLWLSLLPGALFLWLSLLLQETTIDWRSSCRYSQFLNPVSVLNMRLLFFLSLLIWISSKCGFFVAWESFCMNGWIFHAIFFSTNFCLRLRIEFFFELTWRSLTILLKYLTRCWIFSPKFLFVCWEIKENIKKFDPELKMVFVRCVLSCLGGEYLEIVDVIYMVGFSWISFLFFFFSFFFFWKGEGMWIMPHLHM